MHGTAAQPDPTDLEAQGLPDLEDQPPGITAETMPEGMVPLRDHPRGAEEPITAGEQRVPEPMPEREARLQPEWGRVERAAPGRLVQPDQGMVGAAHEESEVGQLAADAHGLAAEEEEVVVHVVDEGTRRRSR